MDNMSSHKILGPRRAHVTWKSSTVSGSIGMPDSASIDAKLEPSSAVAAISHATPWLKCGAANDWRAPLASRVAALQACDEMPHDGRFWLRK